MQFARVYYRSKQFPTQVEGGDLFFSGTRPLLVFKWRRRQGEQVPEECIELDPAKLKSASTNGTVYRYEGEVSR